jgi:hypothetical protein
MVITKANIIYISTWYKTKVPLRATEGTFEPVYKNEKVDVYFFNCAYTYFYSFAPANV